MEIRYLNDMRGVLYDKKWAKKAPNLELYYMYRGIKKKNSLRYDITVIPSLMLGEEFVKTKGHEHSGNFQELYTVLQGEALYLAQKTENNIVQDVFAVRAKKGQGAIIPIGYGHVTINPAAEELKEANWLDEKCQNVYDLFIRNKGACYYYTEKGWIKNRNYKKVPKLRFEKPLKYEGSNFSRRKRIEIMASLHGI